LIQDVSISIISSEVKQQTKFAAEASCASFGSLGPAPGQAGWDSSLCSAACYQTPSQAVAPGIFFTPLLNTPVREPNQAF